MGALVLLLRLVHRGRHVVAARGRIVGTTRVVVGSLTQVMLLVTGMELMV
jgi:hypothetical protein